MPLSDILMLSAIVSAFTIFGLVLAWGDLRTRHLERHRPHLVTESNDQRGHAQNKAA